MINLLDGIILEKIIHVLDRKTILALVCLSKEIELIFKKSKDGLFHYIINRDCYFLNYKPGNF